MCEGHKKREIEVLDKKRQELAQRIEEIGQREEDSNLELQEILLKENSQMWDRIEAYERYAEQEKALRTQAVSMLQRLEEKIFGTKRITPTERKRPRVNMIRVEEGPDEVDQRISELIEKGESITREFDRTQEENFLKQRKFNIRHKELLDQFHRKEMPCHKDLLDLSHEQINFDAERREKLEQLFLRERSLREETIKELKQRRQGFQKSLEKNFKKLFKDNEKVKEDNPLSNHHHNQSR
jgi:hypothetical protein